MNNSKEVSPIPPKENLFWMWRAVETKSQMRQRSLDFVEYIWLRRLCHHFDILGIEQEDQLNNTLRINHDQVQSEMEELRNITTEASDSDEDGTKISTHQSPLKKMSVFSFLDAIRLHKSVSEIERNRKGPEAHEISSEQVQSLPFTPGVAFRNGINFSAKQTQPSSTISKTDNPQAVLEQADVPSNTSSPQNQNTGEIRYVQQGQSTADLQTTQQNLQSITKSPVVKMRPEYTYTYSYSDALKYAIMYGHLEYTHYVLENHLESALLETVCCPLLLVAVRLGHPDIIELLCSHSRRKSTHNYYINKPGCSAMECGRTALHVSAEMGNVSILKLLLKYGANTEVKDDYGHTPLNRVLFRLQPPHITINTTRCIHELLKSQRTISVTELTAISRILVTSAESVTELDKPAISNIMDLVPGPFSLKHICRCAIRNTISYPYLPQGLHDLDLPKSVVHFLSLGD